MNDMEFRELVEIAVEKLKDETVRQLLSDNAVYQKDCEMENEAEANYMQLDLTAEQKEICGHLLQCRDRQDYEYATYSYIAGMYDAFRIMSVLFPERWELDKIEELISTSSIKKTE
ncbi:MAG: hypothetical protein Q4B37_09065 [Eubacteriales bacterium]|nr:hypothetical protein [Eubacteriales bacterium]